MHHYHTDLPCHTCKKFVLLYCYSIYRESPGTVRGSTSGSERAESMDISKQSHCKAYGQFDRAILDINCKAPQHIALSQPYGESKTKPGCEDRCGLQTAYVCYYYTTPDIH